MLGSREGGEDNILLLGSRRGGRDNILLAR